jgi:hypothetical protein
MSTDVEGSASERTIARHHALITTVEIAGDQQLKVADVRRTIKLGSGEVQPTGWRRGGGLIRSGEGNKQVRLFAKLISRISGKRCKSEEKRKRGRYGRGSRSRRRRGSDGSRWLIDGSIDGKLLQLQRQL